MSKTYSNRALPAGTILREWRLEEVLGVGGFGIVYKGRGIYFDELVAIKEYFPSATSERNDDETVVPVDSSAEEVHALGLKKFVEEAKLLWNLSTPSRHPNIVSVRSLFEIHGTAYMVMDFEDGTPLSRLLKQGMRFNEASLRKMIIPICEGLDRAHRVGVLHRDIKPPNIMVGDDGRSVLIDFGSARFESGEATSTTVTFHTPPYAAIEQYVRTYEQGPWTDIYALGVVLYECITGEKPAEVLERVHGEAGQPLVERDLPGFSKEFLSGIDAAMALRPDERPQSIARWLELLESGSAAGMAPANEADDEEDEDDRTRIGGFADDLYAVASSAGSGLSKNRIATGVPDTPSKAEYLSPKDREDRSEEPLQEADQAPATADVPLAAPESIASPDKQDAKKKSAVAEGKPSGSDEGSQDSRTGKSKLVIAGIGAALVVAASGAYLLSSGDEQAGSALAELPEEGEAGYSIADSEAILSALADEARAAGISDTLVDLLALPTDLPDDPSVPLEGGLQPLLTQFASSYAETSRRRFDAIPAPTRNANEGAVSTLSDGLAVITQASRRVSESTSDEDALGAMRDLIATAGEFNSTLADLRVPEVEATALAIAEPSSAVANADRPLQPSSAAMATPLPVETGSGNTVSSATMSEFRSAVRESRSLVDRIIELERRDRPGMLAGEDARAAQQVRRENAERAREYGAYLDSLEASMRQESSAMDAAQLMANAYQTRGYLRGMLRQSQETLQ
ncbi:serine/threonine protein kinase [Aurantiacibacter hainanensis]|uniref:serine/threonine protein kinase n=1 Tax=Aurantiacibacter hainanensis TaxID=3076114 RepID=UPI0030C6C0A8